jgi:hypothetical protein
MITLEEIKNILIKYHVPEDSYSLTGGLPSERYCILNTGSRWEVYYSERGLQTGLRLFNSEYEACDYFLNQIRKAGLLKDKDR